MCASKRQSQSDRTVCQLWLWLTHEWQSMKIPKYKPRHRWPIHSNATNQFATQKHKRISSYTTKYGQNACSNKQNETQQDFMPVWSIHIWRRLGNHNRPHSLVLQQRLTNKLCHQSCHTDCFLLKPLCNWTVSNSSLRKQKASFQIYCSLLVLAA